MTYLLFASCIFAGSVMHTMAHDNEIVEDLLDIIFKLKGRKAIGKLQIPAFNAVLSKDFTPPLNQIIKFDTVQTNIGGHYSPNTGIFTAPKAGLYTFAATVRSTSGKYLHCELQVNDKMVEKAFGTNFSTGAVNAVLQLKKGDRVCIKKDHRQSEDMLGRSWSMFSGYMIA